MIKKVFIGVGHGGSDSGATSDGFVEKNINLLMALTCKDELERHGIIVRMSRTTDENDSVSQEVIECNIFKPDIAIDCHNNAGGGDGFEAYYWPGSTDGLRLARLIEAEMKAIGQNSRGVKTGKNLKFINSTKCTAVLTEGFFIDNATDRTIGDTADEQQEFGRAYAKAILKYFGIPYQSISDKIYRVQVGAFSDIKNANKLVNELKVKGYDAYIR